MREALHIDDFIEMLERDDPIERIAIYCNVKPTAISRRFQRLPEEVKERIIAKRTNLTNVNTRKRDGI